MVLELLKRRDELSDIATIMYGDLYVCHEDFWGSPLENEMREVEESLHNLGWDEEQSPSVIESSIVVLNDLLDRKG
jgi:hypothetical protein